MEEYSMNAKILLDFHNDIENKLFEKSNIDKRKNMNDNELINFAKWVQNEEYFWDSLGKDHAGHKKGELIWMKDCDGPEIVILKTSEELLKEYKNEKHSTQC